MTLMRECAGFRYHGKILFPDQNEFVDESDTSSSEGTEGTESQVKRALSISGMAT